MTGELVMHGNGHREIASCLASCWTRGVSRAARSSNYGESLKRTGETLVTRRGVYTRPESTHSRSYVRENITLTSECLLLFVYVDTLKLKRYRLLFCLLMYNVFLLLLRNKI